MDFFNNDTKTKNAKNKRKNKIPILIYFSVLKWRATCSSSTCNLGLECELQNISPWQILKLSFVSWNVNQIIILLHHFAIKVWNVGGKNAILKKCSITLSAESKRERLLVHCWFIDLPMSSKKTANILPTFWTLTHTLLQLDRHSTIQR